MTSKLLTYGTPKKLFVAGSPLKLVRGEAACACCYIPPPPPPPPECVDCQTCDSYSELTATFTGITNVNCANCAAANSNFVLRPTWDIYSVALKGPNAWSYRQNIAPCPAEVPYANHLVTAFCGRQRTGSVWKTGLWVCQNFGQNILVAEEYNECVERLYAVGRFLMRWLLEDASIDCDMLVSPTAIPPLDVIDYLNDDFCDHSASTCNLRRT